MDIKTQNNAPIVFQEYSPVEPEAYPNLALPFINNLVVIIPAYNEARFIGSIVLMARQYARAVIVVDDGSRDDTARIAHMAGAKVVQHKSNRGKGAALNTGFETARLLDPDVTVMMDADGQHLPGEIDAVIAPVLEGKADLVVGSRYLLHKDQMPRHLVWGHWIFNGITRIASGEVVSDSQSGFRAFSRRALQVIEFKSQGFSVESEMQFIAHEAGLKLAEAPITVRYLDRPKRSVFSQGFAVLAGILRLTSQYRPLAFFGIPGLVLLLAGFFCGNQVMERFQSVHQPAIGAVLVCVLLLIAGSLCIFTGLMLHSLRSMLTEVLKNRLR